jgi:MtN3 and saliva related transmembrane protein
METVIFGVGLVAAGLTSLSYVPQVRKAYPRGATGDLSLTTIAVLGAGLALWIIYGACRRDVVIMLANGVGLALVATLLAFKIRDRD